jgi:hypothetical protein
MWMNDAVFLMMKEIQVTGSAETDKQKVIQGIFEIMKKIAAISSRTLT